MKADVGCACVRVYVCRWHITELKSHISIRFFPLLLLLPSCHSAVFRAAPFSSKSNVESPQCTGGNAVPITAAAGVRPWQQASKLPQTGCKMTNYPCERLGWEGVGGRRDLEKYGFYLIQLNIKTKLVSHRCFILAAR